jgi:hypothetical protein
MEKKFSEKRIHKESRNICCKKKHYQNTMDHKIQKIILSTITTSKNIIIPSNLKDNCDERSQLQNLK